MVHWGDYLAFGIQSLSTPTASGSSSSFPVRNLSRESTLIVDDLLRKGFTIINIKEEKILHVWQSVVKMAFLLPAEDKLCAGKYRNENGLAIGYRVDESREFFETRLRIDGSLNRLCDPLLPVESYNDTILALWRLLSSIGIQVLTKIAQQMFIDPNFLIGLTDLHTNMTLPKNLIVNDSVSIRSMNSDTASSNSMLLSSSVLRICR